MKQKTQESWRPSINKAMWPYLIVIFPILSFLSIIRENKPLSNSMSGMPWSDAVGWRSCSASLAEYGTLPSGGVEEFCLRRPIFPFFLGMVKFVLRNDGLVLTFLLVLFIIALSLFMKSIIENGLVFFGVLISGIAIVKWNSYGAGQFMTESIGIIISLLIIRSCISYLHNFSHHHFVVLLFYVVLLDLVRPSDPFFKFLIVGFYLMTAVGLREKIYGLISALIFIFIFPNLLKVVGSIIGYEQFLTKGNNWAIMYGLVNGNQNYHFSESIRSEYPQMSEIEFWEILKSESIRMILNDPFVLIKPVIANMTDAIKNLDRVVFTANSSSETKYFLSLFFGLSIVAIIIACLFRIKSTSFSKMETVLHLKQQVFSILMLLSPLMGYSISYLNDAQRTNSASLIYGIGGFLFAILNVFGKPGGTDKDEATAIKQIRNFNIRDWIHPGSVAIILIATVLFAPIGKELPESGPLKCEKAGSFRVARESILIKRVAGITLEEKFPWYLHAADLHTGYLIEGHYLVGGKIFHGSFYLNSNRREEVNACLEIIELNPNQSSAQLGFTEVRVSS
jgi:hypothetical protein